MVDPQIGAAVAPSLLDRIFKVCSFVGDEIRQALKEDIDTYVGTYRDKFSSIKTFIYENRVPFDKVYFPLLIKHKNSSMVVPECVDSLFKDYKYISLLGHAGCGKSMILRHLFLSACKTSEKIPIVIELRKLNDTETSFSEYIESKVFNHRLSQNKQILRRMLDSGSFLFLLDGYDEVSLNIKDRITHELEEFVDLHPSNFYLLTSRPGAGAEQLERFENFSVCGLVRPLVFDFIDRQLSIENIEENKELATKIKDVLSKEGNDSYMRYMSSPLLLSMFIMTFNNHPELPTRKSSFYFNVFDTLYSKHDAKSKSGGYQHEKKTKMSEDEFRLVLELFCFISYFNSVYEFTPKYIHDVVPLLIPTLNLDFITDDLIYDLSVSISIWIQDGEPYIFPHRSLQEYFAASYIARNRDDAKTAIYKKFTSLKPIECENFFGLCDEIDESCFNQYFIIPALEEILMDLNKIKDSSISREENILLNFLNMVKIEFYFRDSNSNICVVCRVPKVFAVLYYLKLSIATVNEPMRCTLEKEYMSGGSTQCPLLREDNTIKLDPQDRRPEVLAYYKESKFMDRCLAFVKSIEQKLEEKKQLVESLKQSSDLVLSLLR